MSNKLIAVLIETKVKNRLEHFVFNFNFEFHHRRIKVQVGWLTTFVKFLLIVFILKIHLHSQSRYKSKNCSN